MTNYAEDTFKPHLRITILRLLEHQGGYRSNCSLLRDAAEAVGLTATRDQVRVELAWLAEQGLVTVRQVEQLMIATATERGLDVAAGRARVPGVKTPSP